MGALLGELREAFSLAPTEAAMLLAVLWTLAALLGAAMPPRIRRRLHAPALLGGVPILGLLTYAWGPEIGLAALIAGLLALAFLRRRLRSPET